MCLKSDIQRDKKNVKNEYNRYRLVRGLSLYPLCKATPNMWYIVSVSISGMIRITIRIAGIGGK